MKSEARPVRRLRVVVASVALLMLITGFQNCAKFEASSLSLSSVDPSPPTKKAGPHLTLSWSTDPLSQQDSFVVEKSSDGVAYSSLKTVSSSATSVSIDPAADGIVLGQKYYFRIKAVNSAGESLFSKIVSATVPVPAAAH